MVTNSNRSSCPLPSLSNFGAVAICARRGLQVEKKKICLRETDPGQKCAPEAVEQKCNHLEAAPCSNGSRTFAFAFAAGFHIHG